MKTYHDIQGDGGSDVIGQVKARQQAIDTALAGVRHVLAVGSGKGGVGKSTVTSGLARSFQRRGWRVAVLDGDLNGPCQARLLGVEGQPWVPGEGGLSMPRSAEGIGVVSFGSLLPEAQPLDFDSVSKGEEHTWRATREFAMLAQLLGSMRWGELDLLLFDLPPGSERTVQFADFLGARASFVLVTIPSDLSRGVVARSISALRASGGRLLGYVENMAGYYCHGCGQVKPLFPSAGPPLKTDKLGEIPFDPEWASTDDGVSPGLEATAQQIHDLLEASS